MPMVLNVPPCFTETVSTNITWLGGAAPYSLVLNFQDSNHTPIEFNNIKTTHFLWTTSVPAGTLVFLQITDERGFIDFNEDPIYVRSGPDIRPVSVSTGFTSTSTFTFQASTPSPIQGSNPSSNTSTHANTRTIALVVIGATIFLFLATLPWWRSRVRTGRRENRNSGNSTLFKLYNYFWGADRAPAEIEKPEVVGGGYNNSASPETNPFEDPENALHADKIIVASPASNANDRMLAQSSVTRSMPSPSAADTTLLMRPSRLKLIPRSRTPSKPIPSLSVRSYSDFSGTPPLPEAHTTRLRLSISTSSTLPPSYHTRPSSRDIDIQEVLNYPQIPPPVYTPQLTEGPECQVRSQMS
ncbi:hypothetical protein GSI_08456 [Ganoderma sinense ZZ0214-1]|uniref:Uncharacterized protein n=1 Tax=Ganoderma sinense ZZ0214-1 TaxID=1077348 RepID=A0A2G8S3S7_9APHY|nr:hypothetical protein GSI_08456 [Ganoderma sinense ZZ0214-1]